jgi:hypothetical protein
MPMSVLRKTCFSNRGFNNDRLAERFRHQRGKRTGDGVGAAIRRERNH